MDKDRVNAIMAELEVLGPELALSDSLCATAKKENHKLSVKWKKLKKELEDIVDDISVPEYQQCQADLGPMDGGNNDKN